MSGAHGLGAGGPEWAPRALTGGLYDVIWEGRGRVLGPSPQGTLPGGRAEGMTLGSSLEPALKRDWTKLRRRDIVYCKTNYIVWRVFK